jgi:hypothetical protein
MIFEPLSLGVLDISVEPNVFSTVATTGSTTGDLMYSGSAVVGTTVVFPPLTPDHIGRGLLL